MMTNAQIKSSIKSLVNAAIDSKRRAKRYRESNLRDLAEWSEGRQSGFLQAARFVANDLRASSRYEY
jgi:hypothetical protein